MPEENEKDNRACFLSCGGETTGPLPREEVEAMVARGQLEDGTCWWCEGMSDWQPIATLRSEPRERTPAAQTTKTKKAVWVGFGVAAGAAALVALAAAGAWTILAMPEKAEPRLASLHRVSLDLRPEN